MQKIIEFIKEKKILIIITLILVISIIVGIFIYIDYKQKQYVVEEITDYKYSILKTEDGKVGVIDKYGKVIINPDEQTIIIPNPQKAVFISQKDNKTKVLNENQESIFTQYEDIKEIDIKGTVSNVPYEKSVLKYKEDGKYGLITYEGKIITKPLYDQIDGLENKEGEMLVKKEEKYGVINSKGATIIKPDYDSIVADGYYTDNEKYALSGYIIGLKTHEGYRYGYINYKLQKTLKVEYNLIYRILELKDYKNIYLIAARNGQQGIVKNGNVIINYAYQDIEYDDYNNLFKLTRSSKHGVSDMEGKEIIPIEYQEINFNGIYIKATKEDGVNFYFNSTGQEITNNIYESVLRTNNDNYFITIDSNGKYGIINKNEQVLQDNKYMYIEYVYDDYFIAAKDSNLLGIIDASGNIKIDFKYEVLQKVDNTKVIEAKILKENKTELYGSDLNKIYSKQNITVVSYTKYIKVYSADEVKYFNENGQELQNTQLFQNNLYSSQKNGKWGFIDKEGNVIIDFIYDRTIEFNKEGFAGIKLENKWGIIDKEGNIILEPKYKIDTGNADPEFAGTYYKVYFGYGENYYTNEVKK